MRPFSLWHKEILKHNGLKKYKIWIKIVLLSFRNWFWYNLKRRIKTVIKNTKKNQLHKLPLRGEMLAVLEILSQFSLTIKKMG